MAKERSVVAEAAYQWEDRRWFCRRDSAGMKVPPETYCRRKMTHVTASHSLRGASAYNIVMLPVSFAMITPDLEPRSAYSGIVHRTRLPQETDVQTL